MTPRDKCLTAALQRQTGGDCAWMSHLDDIAVQRRREKALLASLTRFVRQTEHAPPVQRKACQSKRIALPQSLVSLLDCAVPIPHWTKSAGQKACRIPVADPFERICNRTTNREALHRQKLAWDEQMRAEWSKRRKLRQDREDAEYTARYRSMDT